MPRSPRIADRPIRRFGLVGLPAPETAGRKLAIRLVAVVAIGLSSLYLLWRATSTLDPVLLPISVLLLALEVHQLVGLVLFTHALWDIDVRPSVPDDAPMDLRLAIVIPTVNESVDVLLPVIAAAQACDLPHETFVLDDGGRPAIAELTRRLGARYISRTRHEHAKAGNLNDWLEAHGDRFEMMAVLDADHVPAPTFLSATVGYFSDPKVAVVQTPQEFYNPSFEYDDPDDFAEQKLFYRVIEPGKNRVGAAFWCGTGAVVRIAALRAVGGVWTGSITEDIATTLRLHSEGWRSVYHNEVQAVGLAAPDAGTYAAQRVRWGTGAMQVLRTLNPLTLKGLSLGQRVAYLTTLTGWFDSWRTAGYMTVPMFVVVVGAVPIAAPLAVFLPVWATVFVLQQAAMAALARGLYRPLGSLVFEVVRMEPGMRATASLLLPGERRFRVTPKGRVGSGRQTVPLPRVLLGFIVAGTIALAYYVLTLSGLTPLHYAQPFAASVGAAWLVTNLLVELRALRRVRSARFAPERRDATRFSMDIEATFDGQTAHIVDLSTSGAQLTMATEPGTTGTLAFDGLDGVRVEVPARVTVHRPGPEASFVAGLAFERSAVEARAEVARLLFAHPLHRPAAAPEATAIKPAPARLRRRGARPRRVPVAVAAGHAPVSRRDRQAVSPRSRRQPAAEPALGTGSGDRT